MARRGRGWKFVANNGNGERIQVEIARCGRLPGRGSKLGQTSGLLRTFSSLKEKKAGIRLLSRLRLETRSSEFFARGRCSSSSRFPLSSYTCFFPFSSIDRQKTKLPPKTVSIHDTGFFNRVSNPWLYRTKSWNRKKIFSSLQNYIYISFSILNFIDVLIRFNMLLNWLLKLMSCYGYGCHQHVC